MGFFRNQLWLTKAARLAPKLCAIAIIAILSAPVFQARSVQAQDVTAQGFQWKNVKIGGSGCWVTGVVVHPTSNATYIRTDVGGASRWNPGGGNWVPLSNHFREDQSNFYGVESIAVDPSSSRGQTVYMAAGKYLYENGAIFKSTNGGEDWVDMGLRGVPMGANDQSGTFAAKAARTEGERLAISPNNSGNTILFGSRTKGLWRGTVASGATTASWTQITSIPIVENPGVVAVAFDNNTDATGANRAYAVVEGSGVYLSTNDGQSWSLIAGSAGYSNITRLVVGADHDMWISHGAGISKYAGGSWYNFNPDATVQAYSSVAVNPADANELLASNGTYGTFGGSASGYLYRSTNNGWNWTKVPATRVSDVPWAQQKALISLSCLAFSVGSPKQVWAADWNGIGRINDLNASPMNLVSYENGHEETVVNTIAAPPAGAGVVELYSGMLDVHGFRHDNGVDQYPSSRILPSGGHTTSLAYQGTSSGNMMRIDHGDRNGVDVKIYVSSDGGQTWSVTADIPGHIPLQGVIAADNSSTMVVMCSGKLTNGTADSTPWYYTNNGGASWSVCQGLPASAAPANGSLYLTKKNLAADLKNPGTFYVYNRSDGRLYRSTSGGSSFSWVNDPNLGGDMLPALSGYQLKAPPDAAYHLWAGFKGDGLYRSVSGGKNWQKISGVTSVTNFAFGKAAPESTMAALYLYGRMGADSEDKIYRSLDRGVTWRDMTDPDNRIGNIPQTMEGSMQNFGRLFIGTNGSGLFYADDKTLPGDGTGLTGYYYSSSGSTKFTTFVKSQVDPTVDFQWGTGSPTNTDGTTMSSIGPDNFAVAWKGQIQARESGDYIFSVYTDDGVRLWLEDVTGTPVIDNWVNQAPTRVSYTRYLTAGQRINVKMDYYESAYGATAQLEWIRPGHTEAEREIIPQTQLIPN